LIDDLLHCCFTASFDKLKLKINEFVLDERINKGESLAVCAAACRLSKKKVDWRGEFYTRLGSS
jgi:hypothetical protein